MRIRAVQGVGGVWLSLDGEVVFVADAGELASGTASSPAAGAPVSPMPGRVVKVLVKEGERVKAGQPLAAVEAMKMEYLVRAPSAGAVGRIDRKSTRLNSSHSAKSRMPSSA